MKPDCGDNSCLFVDRSKPTGMRTNGGCRCFRKAGFADSATQAARQMLPELLDLRAEVGRGTAANWPDWLSSEYRAIVEMVKAAMDRAEDDICNSEDASGLPRTYEGERNSYAGAIVHAFKMAGRAPPVTHRPAQEGLDCPHCVASGTGPLCMSHALGGAK